MSLCSLKLVLYSVGSILIGGLYLYVITTYPDSIHDQVTVIQSVPLGQILDIENKVNLDLSLKETKTETDTTTFLKSMMNLPSWYRTGDWGLRKNVTLETVIPHNEWKWNDEEEIIAWNNFFHGTTNGIILELGALDGKSWSVSQFFEAEVGWRSILIEGNPKEAALIPTNRPNAITFNIVICKEPRTVHFVQAGGVGGILEFMAQGFLTEFHSKLLTNGKLDDQKIVKANNVIKLSCVPLTQLLYPLNINHINFFMLDVEGGELNVLKAIDFDKIKFDVIAVETDRGTDSKEDTKNYVDSVIEFLTAKGYILWNRKLGRNSWFKNIHFVGYNKNQTK